MIFDEAFARLIGNEGGFTDNPADTGNWTGGAVGHGICRGTNWGISAAAYPNLDIKSLTCDDAKAIYLRDFWQAGHMDAMPGALAFQAFDAAVNHGIEEANRLVQAAAGVTQDGAIGPVTLAAIASKEPDDLVVLFVAARLDFWTGLSGWDDFGKGWARRAASDLRYAAQDL